LFSAFTCVLHDTIAGAFFENFEEGPSEGVFTSIRHFRAVKK
jgi:hypothetical protein